MNSEFEQEEEFIEVMYNSCYGGFGFSELAVSLYCEGTNKKYDSKDKYYAKKISMDISRHDKKMIQIVKTLGVKANGPYSAIQIEKIPARYKEWYSIEEYDGMETIIIEEEKFLFFEENKKLKEENLLYKNKIEKLENEIIQLKNKLNKEKNI